VETIESFAPEMVDWVRKMQKEREQLLEDGKEQTANKWAKPPIGAAGDRKPLSAELAAQLIDMPSMPYQDDFNCLPKALFGVIHQHPIDRFRINSATRRAIMQKTTANYTTMSEFSAVIERMKVCRF
jgi:hypothetical protein